MAGRCGDRGRGRPEEARRPAAARRRAVRCYTINWPTGLSLGEAKLTDSEVKTTEAGERWTTEFSLDASVPGFPVMEHARSTADAEFCSLELEKQYTHGKRKADEKTTFDQQKGTATRETKDGGKAS